jgi:hypothetical protein
VAGFGVRNWVSSNRRVGIKGDMGRSSRCVASRGEFFFSLFFFLILSNVLQDIHFVNYGLEDR